MKIALVLIVIIVAAAYFFYAKKEAGKRTNSELKKTIATAAKPQYRCVIINTGLKACQAAQDLALKPILVNEAPALPLKTCDAARCECKFTKQNDRRFDDRREHLKVAKEIMEDANNRRDKKERRKRNH